MANNQYVNKVQYMRGGQAETLIDLTADTVTAATLMQGYTAHDASGAPITGTASGGGGDTYTLTTVVPQQTFTAQDLGGSYQTLVTYTAGLEDGEAYLVTFDGEEYLCECGVYWGTEYMAATIDYFWNSGAAGVYPFGLDYSPSGNELSVGVGDTSQHTIKVEHLEFVDGPLTIIPKSITANGTYSAASDNADGYSSVTVNVSGGMDVPVFTVVMDSEWSAAQSVTCSMTFAECRNYINDNDMALVEMSAQGDSDSVLYSASLYQGSTTEIMFVMFLGGIPQADVSIMSNGTCSYVTQPSSVTTLTATANGTYTDSLSRLYSEVTVNVPSGSSMNVQVAQSTTRVASTTYTKTASLTCSKSGTYDVYWDCFRSSTSGTNGSQLYIGGSAYGNPNTTFATNNHAQTNHLTGVQISANQEVAVYVRSRATNYYAYCGQLTIVQTA